MAEATTDLSDPADSRNATDRAETTDSSEEPNPPGPDPDSPGPDPDSPTARSTGIIAGPGGVMTDEVGVITGELTLCTELDAGQVTLWVQYLDADEWYVVTGGRAPLADEADLDAVHTIAVGLLDRPEG